METFHEEDEILPSKGQLEAATRSSSIKKVFVKFSQKSQENTCAGGFFWQSVRLEAWHLIKKETSTQMVFFLKTLQSFLCKQFYKLSKSKKIGASVKCLRGDFLQFPSAIVKIVISSGQLDTSL